jgi:hypothetical protein
MNELLQDNLNNRTNLTDTEMLEKFWLGVRDSNPRMLVPKTSVLPLDEPPIGIVLRFAAGNIVSKILLL